jgi:signal transduction histidine kinase
LQERRDQTKAQRGERYSVPTTLQLAEGRPREAYNVARADNPMERRADGDLAAAVAHVVETWRTKAPIASGVSPTEVEALLAALAEAVQQSRQGKPCAVDPRASSVLGGHLLPLLRTALIRGWANWDPAPDAANMLRTLTAIERVVEAIEANRPHDFAAQLAGPDGLEVLVEVAHDLRSPLTSILFLAETLQRGQSGTVNELQHRQLGLIYSAALGLSSLASDATELARNGNELLEDGPSPFSLKALFESVRDVVHPMAEEKGLEVRLASYEPDQRLGNPLALGRVLLNLTSNALKFTEQGYVEIRAEARTPTRVQFSVRDTGRGIGVAALNTLYEPLRRTAGRAGYCFSGTGLGLAICRKLVAAMGSVLQIETRADWGTRFYFDLEAPPAPTP